MSRSTRGWFNRVCLGLLALATAGCSSVLPAIQRTDRTVLRTIKEVVKVPGAVLVENPQWQEGRLTATLKQERLCSDLFHDSVSGFR